MKLLAVDFDNTLYSIDNYDQNIEYINKFVDDGHIFAIVTGRHIESLLRDIRDKDLNYSYLICNDGGIIFDKDLNIIYQKNIPNTIAYDIANIYESSSCLDDWYIDTGITITKDRNSNANGLIGRFHNKNEAVALLEFLKDEYHEIGGYISERWINITEKSVNKGSAIKTLISKINIDEENVYTIGDNINDLSMSNYKFNNYCMTDSIIDLRNVTLQSYDTVHELVADILKDGLK